MFQTLRFAPLYRVVAALAALVLVAYVTSLVFAPLQRRVNALRDVRVLGRIVAIGLAAWLTWGALGDASFVLRRGGAQAVIRTNLDFLLILALAVFLEVRFSRWSPRR